MHYIFVQYIKNSSINYPLLHFKSMCVKNIKWYFINVLLFDRGCASSCLLRLATIIASWCGYWHNKAIRYCPSWKKNGCLYSTDRKIEEKVQKFETWEVKTIWIIEFFVPISSHFPGYWFSPGVKRTYWIQTRSAKLL